MLYYVLSYLWFFIGAGGFVYWWTSKYDLTVSDLPLAVLVSFCGPFSWIMGFFIYTDIPSPNWSKIILKARK